MASASPSATVSCRNFSASATAWMACASPSARRICCCLSPSARRTAAGSARSRCPRGPTPHVVGGDDLLWRDVDDLLPHVDGPQCLDERHDHAEAGLDGLLVLAELLDQALLVGPDDLDPGGHVDEQDDRHDEEE